VQGSENAACNAGCNGSRITKGAETLGTSESTIKETENDNPFRSAWRKKSEVRHNLDRYAEFIDANPSYVVSEALKLLFKKDDEFRRWAGQHTNDHREEQIQGEALTKTA
jgi:hypothetical protein